MNINNINSITTINTLNTTTRRHLMYITRRINTSPEDTLLITPWRHTLQSSRSTRTTHRHSSETLRTPKNNPATTQTSLSSTNHLIHPLQRTNTIKAHIISMTCARIIILPTMMRKVATTKKAIHIITHINHRPGHLLNLRQFLSDIPIIHRAT